MTKKNEKRKIVISGLILILFFSIFLGLWNVVSGGYDKQNKIILFLKEIIPTKISRQIRDTIFIIPKLREERKLLRLIVQKYEQKLEGNLFNEKIITSKNLNNNYILREFFIPFTRINLDKGWQSDENAFTKHYLEIDDDKIIIASGGGEIIYFKKKNIHNQKLKQIKIQNNILKLLSNKKFMGIRDLYLDEDKKIYISLYFEDQNGYSVNIYSADLNYKKIEFELFFETKEYWKDFTVRTGGRINSFKDNKILLSLGDFGDEKSPQKLNNLKGKIISINKTNKEFEIVSLGHRNQQGLLYLDDINVIVNSEHGPKGGDEINLNFLKKKEPLNFGWAVSSYGTGYSGQDIYKKSHKKFGFIEPFKFYDPSIGISQIDFNNEKKTLLVSSLRAGSIFKLKVDNSFNNIISEDRIFFPEERIRDIKYDKETTSLFLIFERVPSFAVLKLN